MAEQDCRAYVARLNEWHLELAMLTDLIEHLLAKHIEYVPGGSQFVPSLAHVCELRLRELVESCPFPEPGV